MASMIQLVEIEPIVIKNNSEVDVTIKYRDFDRVDSILQKVYFDFDVIDVLNSKVIATINQKAIKKCLDLTTVAKDTITWKNHNLFGKDNQIDAILAYMNSKTKMNVRIKVYSDNSSATGVSYCETTISVATDCVKPKFDISCIDTNESTINVTGDNQKLINTLSKMSISCAELNTYGASVSKSRFYVDGVLKATYTNGTTIFNNITVTKSSNKGFDCIPFNIRIELTDSRGAVSSIAKDFQLISYQLPSFSKWTVKRYDNSDSNVQAILEGTVSPLIIDGVVKNRIESIDFRYKLTKNTAYSKIYSSYEIIQNTDNTFEFNTNALVNLNQKYSYNLQIYVTDSLATSKPLNFVISKTIAFISFRNSERLGINNTNPKYTVDMKGDMNVDGKLLINGDDVTLSINNIASEVGLILGMENNNDVIGLQVDYENKKFTRLAGAVGLNAGTDFNKFNMYGGRKRCAVAKDGTIKAFYGDDDYNDSGSSADGQIMVYQPKFYYKVVPLKMDKITDGSGYHIRKANYYVTDKALAGFKLHPAFYDENGNEVDYILYSAYEGCYWDSSMQTYFKDGTMDDAEIDFARDSINSISGKKPISGAIKNLTTTNLELLAQNLGHGWHLETIKTLSANQLLMMIELGTMNVQTAIGKGIAAFSSNAEFNASSLTGSTKSLGNITGVAASTKNEIGGVETSYNEEGKIAVSYRGMENPWGNIYKFINGINIWGDGTMLGGQPYIAGDFNFDATKHTENYGPAGFTLPNGAGYISAMGYGSEKYDWLFMPSEIKGNSSLPVGDYAAAAVDADGYRTVAHGGACYNNLAAGIFDCYCSALANGKGRTFGGRIIYIPTAE